MILQNSENRFLILTWGFTSICQFMHINDVKKDARLILKAFIPDFYSHNHRRRSFLSLLKKCLLLLAFNISHVHDLLADVIQQMWGAAMTLKDAASGFIVFLLSVSGIVHLLLCCHGVGTLQMFRGEWRSGGAKLAKPEIDFCLFKGRPTDRCFCFSHLQHVYVFYNLNFTNGSIVHR